MASEQQKISTNNIKLFREGAGLTQNDLALKTLISAPTLRRYEKGGVKISAQNQQAIADALHQAKEVVFPNSPQKEIQRTHPSQINRRDFFRAAAITGAGLGLIGLNPHMLGNPAFLQDRQDLSKDEIQILAEGNYGLWELLNALQRGASINFVASVTQGKLLTLRHMSECSLLPNQHNTMLSLLADAYLLLGRICQEIQDYGSGEAYYRQALSIAQEVGNIDLKAACRQRYGYMLIDQERYRAALQNAEIGLSEGKDAAFPIWGEVQLYAAQCYAHTGNINKARAVAAQARAMERGRDPEIWFGKLLNPKTSYTKGEIVVNLAAEHNDDAVKAAEETLANLDREEPDNLTWRASLQELQARALWQFGRHEEAIATAKESLRNSRTVGSVVNEGRIEKLYHRMQKSPLGKRHSVQELGGILVAS